MESNASLQHQQQQQQQEEKLDEDECMGPAKNTSGFSYPQQSLKTVTWDEAAGKISLTSVVIALALIGNCSSHEIGWKECLRDDQLGVEWDRNLHFQRPALSLIHISEPTRPY